uniref:Type I glutamate--ammonia ligase n=1 Tax=candidate division WOR-3 bacterium TaxID=2052148 RepID=A0A7C4U7Q3_UNCW3
MNITEIIRNENIEFVDIKYVDINGRLRHINFPSEKFEYFLKKGVGIDGSSVPGFASSKFSDMRIFPDASRYFIDPYIKNKTLSLWGDIFTCVEDKPFLDDPRNILKKTEELLKKECKIDNIYILPELEFYIFKNYEVKNEPSFSYLKLEIELEYIRNKYYHIDTPFDIYNSFRQDVCKRLKNIGINVKYLHHEGGILQQEIELEHSTPLISAENIILTKYVLQNEAINNGIKVTFMPKPLNNEPGNGLHLHILPTRNGASIFYGKERNGLSTFGLYFIGGILKHAKALTAFTNPSTNSFKRLFTGFEAPKKIVYSVANRSAALRIPGYEKGSNIDIEYRPPDATMNPFLGISVILLAGLDGVRNKIEPGEPISGEIDTLEKVDELPCNMKDALFELDKDREFIVKDGVFSNDLIDRYIELKEKEYLEIELVPSSLEIEKYFYC